MTKHTGQEKRQKQMALIGAIVVVALFAFLYISLARAKSALETDLAKAIEEKQNIEEELRITNEGLALIQEEKSELEDELRKEKNKNEEFEEQIQDIAGTVGVLEKLSKTDPELLQKYSKVFFLNEHYAPERLKDIDEDFTLNSGKTYQVHAAVEPFLDDLLKDAKDDGIDLRVASAFRSFGEQSSLKSGYVQVYGSGANQFSADQGYSEHQLGTTVDFVTAANPSLTISFENTEAFTWLTKNAHKYGFTLSYPEGNAYYQYEPWHWRFVGVDLAKDLYKDGKHFYDLDQREIDEYLAEIFD
ncbi:MAG: D-alanyl-D-alanine carboxypeptidase family protein [Candidatus Paceibacterota bacterium]